MKKINFRQFRRRKAMGLALMILGLIVVVMPLFVGQWVISLLGIAFVAAGIFYFIDTMRTADETTSYLSYLSGIGFVILGVILFFSPEVALSGTLIAITLYLVADGGIKIYGAFKLTGADRWWSLFNGLFAIGLGLLIWSLVSVNLGGLAIGIALGLKLLVEGWTMFFRPEKGTDAAFEKPDPREHPDGKLKLAPSDTFKEINETIDKTDVTLSGQNVIWCLTLLLILFFIHYIRTESTWSIVGLITPVTATIGDAAVAAILGVALILPIRLLWRKFTRPVERTAWRRFHTLEGRSQDLTLIERGMKFWMEGRMWFAHNLRTMRESLNFAFWNLLKFGLPFTAIFVAINSIWGFSWYFNSENWASGVFQRITQERVNPWRQAMTTETEKLALSNGVPPEKVFAVEPQGTEGDFSFIVIGDTGEGDSSQMILRDQIISASKREDVKFLVLSSDVIYPDGKMHDYEMNFYLPFKGFEKPLYAIPGNHDWFDANEGFNANFLDAASADLALKARASADINIDVTASDEKFKEMIDEAARLRQYYRIDNGHQRAPFFEVQTPGFSLITVDTGITRELDEKQKAWLEDALNRAGENFKLVVLGHPFWVAGKDTTVDAPPGFAEILETLKRHKVAIVMAGDTHDFELYKMKYAAAEGEREMLHFVNGGGGAYLSIGTSVGYPENSVSPDYAYYPRGEEVEAKIKNEAPLWKLPFLIWLQVLQGWPFGQEMVSGAFDFNKSPFFQSFLEVKVERSQNRVRLILYGVHGPLRWRDIHTTGNVKPPDKTDDDPVEWILPLTQQVPVPQSVPQ